MPRRCVKRVPWETESERLVITPSMERRIKKGVIQRSIKKLCEFSLLEDDEDIFYDLASAAFAAFNLGRDHQAADLARRSIDAAASFEQNWNHSNALNGGHTVLGLLALKDGNTAKAIEELYASGDVCGSPQLSSFGPSMQLARELLFCGKTVEVLEFFSRCRQFWTFGEIWLDVWTQKIELGRIPNFFHHRYR